MIYFTRISSKKKINEGGVSRDLAFKQFIESKHNSFKIKEVSSSSPIKKIINFFLFVPYLLCLKNRVVFFHLGSFGNVFPGTLFSTKYSVLILEKILKIIAKKNRLIIEVNDLPIEQAKDLELNLKTYLITYYDTILSLPEVEYVYASKKMLNYCQEKYNLNKSQLYVCINGGKIPENDAILETNSKKIKFIYAGTLNRGRQIEDLINVFLKCRKSDVELILCGISGEWIRELHLTPNIVYLGELSEEEAQLVASKCDIGIVPYDDSRFYYNLCYPTKNSFYITSGIPFLCTNLEETSYWFKDKDCVFFVSFEKWGNFIDKISPEQILQYKFNVKIIREDFEWSNLIATLFEKLEIKLDE